ncbi:MAG: hypothetical protein KIT87_28815 [Anaerolineae bacterium]|nr:hypothetical protein [Anaerolineae bacterium]
MAASTRASFTPQRLTLGAGQSATARLILQNLSDEPRSYLVEMTGAAAGWARLDQDQVSLFPGDESTVRLTVTAPVDIPSGVTGLAAVAKDARTEGVAARAELAVEVTAPVAAPPSPPEAPSGESPVGVEPGRPPETPTAPPRPPSGSGQPTTPPIPAPPPGRSGFTAVRLTIAPVPGPDPGAPPREWLLTLENIGQRLDAFGFRITGLTREWYTVAPREVRLHPGQVAPDPARLTITPPPDAPAGERPFTVTAYSLSDDNAADTRPLTLVLPPRGNASLSVVSGPKETQGQAQFELALTSRPDSNIPQDISLTAQDSSGGCQVRLEPDHVRLLARQASRVRLIIVPLRRLNQGERKTFEIEVAVTASAGQAPAPLKLPFVQVGTPPPIVRLPIAEQADRLKADYTVEVTNPAEVEVGYQFRVTAQEAGCAYVFDPPTLRVPAKTTRTTKLTVQAQTFLEGGDKTYRFAVEALFEGEAAPAGSAPGVFRQTYLDPVLLKLIPDKPLETRGKGRFVVRAVNQLTTPVTVTLEPVDEQAALDFKPGEQTVNLRPGEELDTKFTARCKDGLDAGRRNHDYTVRGYVTGRGTPAAVKGRIVQRPPLIKWRTILGLLARLVFPLLVILFLWLGLHIVNELGVADRVTPLGRVARLITGLDPVAKVIGWQSPFYGWNRMFDPNWQFQRLAYQLADLVVRVLPILQR